MGDGVCSNTRFENTEIPEAVSCVCQSWDALPPDKGRAIAAASVVPEILEDLRLRIAEQVDSSILAVGEELHRPMSLAVEEPGRVGIDRVCSAAAAYDKLRHACVSASFGTAITIDCVNDEGIFMGGAILPGLDMQARALSQGTAQLPHINVEQPREAYGASTEEAISIGLLVGVAGALREITERFATELGTWPDLVATGGNAELIQQRCEIIDRVVPDLCLRGIAIAYQKHFSPFEEAQ